MNTERAIAALRGEINAAMRTAGLPGTAEVGVNDEMQYAWARWDTGAQHMRAIAPLEAGFWRNSSAYVDGFIRLCHTRGAGARALAGTIPAVLWEPTP